MKRPDTPAPRNNGAFRDLLGLEFPDWSGMKPHCVHLSPAEAFRWNEEMLALFSSKTGFRRSSGALRCDVEFKL
jgi:hypothetical protein